MMNSMEYQGPTMSNDKYRDMWKLLRESVIQINIGRKEHLKCAVCSNILINACNAPCGCRYCLGCIKGYLEGKNQFCPSGKDDCKDQMICFERDIQIDHPINKVISKIIVKCPERFCEFKDCLQTIQAHLMTCNLKKDRCPYFPIGCLEYHFSSEDIENHLESEHEWHGKLLVWWMDNLDNEVGCINNNTNELRSKGQEHPLETDLVEKTKIAKIETFKIRAFEYHNTGQTEKLGILFQEVDNEITGSVSGKLVKDPTRKSSVQSTGCPDISVSLYKDGLDDANQKLSKKGNVFIWKIDNFSKKRNLARLLFRTEICSEPFYTHHNGYKLRLIGYPNGFGDSIGTHFSIIFCILKGEFDEGLPWPMVLEINIGLINQDTGMILNNQTYRYDSTPKYLKFVYEKPKNKENRGYGKSKFINLKDLKEMPGTCRNNEILLRCSVSLE